ncbi:MAG: gluconate 2-dehydrogenase subunit 3 family protein [Hyphomicrobiaceae bacterium]|nr:gluconate 2-dehydrogenase subunit 3 family protein [Hyphomicrobiaceae bacterium]
MAGARLGDARLSRRHVITSMAAAAALLGTAGRVFAVTPASTIAGNIPAKLKFFSAAEFALIDTLAETLIPEDAHSGGARAAGVAATLDERLAESRDPDWRQSWHDDLAEIDRLTRERYSKGFVAASDAQRAEIMRVISRNEANPKEAGEYAFGTIKWSVADIYYRTRIGIQDELQYQGNTYQDEFSGTDVSKPG